MKKFVHLRIKDLRSRQKNDRSYTRDIFLSINKMFKCSTVFRKDWWNETYRNYDRSKSVCLFYSIFKEPEICQTCAHNLELSWFRYHKRNWICETAYLTVPPLFFIKSVLSINLGFICIVYFCFVLFSSIMLFRHGCYHTEASLICWISSIY